MKHRLFSLFAISVILASFAGNFIHPASAAASGEDYMLDFKQASFQATEDEYNDSAVYARNGAFGNGPVTFSPGNSSSSTGNHTADVALSTILTGRINSYYPAVAGGHGFYLGSYNCAGLKVYAMIGLTEVTQSNGFGSSQDSVNSEVWILGASKGGSSINGPTLKSSHPNCVPSSADVYPTNWGGNIKSTSLPSYYGMTYSKQQDWFNFLKDHGTTIDSPPGPLGSNPTTPTAGAAGGDDSAQLSCDAGWNPLNWLICAAIKGMVAVLNGVDDTINSLLAVGTPNNSPSGDPSQIFDTNTDTGKAYYKAWSSFRDIALGLLVIAGLVMIIAQALGMEILDAYTIRKVLPRLVVMAILITLSWALLRFVIQLFNDLGYGVRFLIEKPFSSLNNTITLSGGGGVAVALATAAVIVSLGIFGLFTFVLSAVLAAFTAFIVLILRQVVVVALVILAPVALLMYILPNTQRFYKLWFDSFSGALIMFPLIVALIASGRVFAAVANTDNPQSIGGFIAFAAYFAPYFMIPMTYRMAGGIMSGIGNFVNSRAQPYQQALGKKRQEVAADRRHRMAEGNLYRASNPFARGFNRATRGVANVPSAGVTPWKMRSRFQAGMSQHEMTAMNEYMEKSQAFKKVSGNDDYLQATMANMGGGHTEADWRRYLSEHGYRGRALEQGVAAIRAAKRDTNDEVFQRAAVVANASTGTGWKDDGAGAMMASINEAAGGDRDMAAGMLAEMRQRSTQARRTDLGGAGFGGQMRDLNAMYAAEYNLDNQGNSLGHQMTQAEATDRNNEQVLELQGSGGILGARGDTMKLLAPQMKKRLRRAHVVNNQAQSNPNATPAQKAAAERTLKQEYASLAGRYDAMSQSSPENAKIMADTVLKEDLGGQTVQEVIESLRGDDQFLQMRREYGNQAAAAAAAAGNPQGQGPGQQGGQPGGQPGGGQGTN